MGLPRGGSGNNLMSPVAGQDVKSKSGRRNNFLMKPFISVIISTYNHPGFLEITLKSYQSQTYRDFEVIVADDGSTPDTGEFIAQFSRQAGYPIKHAWQEDAGFRLARVRNLGFSQAAGDYVLFSDQDCIAHPDLLQDHVKHAEKGKILQGSRRNFSREMTEKVLQQQILEVKHLDSLSRPYWQYLINNFSMLKIGALTGCNISLFRADIEQLEGFSESYQDWGAEDFDFGCRAYRKNLQLRFLSGRAYVYHLYHQRIRNYLNRNYLKLYWKVLTNKF